MARKDNAMPPLVAPEPVRVRANCRRLAGALLLLGGVMAGIAVFPSAHAKTVSSSVPAFLPPHYSDALQIDGRPLRLLSQDEKQGIRIAQYATASGGIRLNVEEIDCERPRCDVLYGQTVDAQNRILTQSGGRFLTLSSVEASTAWKEGTRHHFRYLARTPKALLSWTWIGPAAQPLRDEKHLGNLRRALNRQRFGEALELSNIEMGHWAREVHQHGLDLLEQGRTDDALAVLRQVIAWSPTSFEAQLDFAEHTLDPVAARASAQAVWENAESAVLTARAAKLLGLKATDSAELPVLEPGLRGLQVVLIPLPPCDIQLLEEAGRLYADSLKVPVRIARLPNPWLWGAPDRVYRQRDIQALIQQKSSKPVDFTGWTREQYAKQLLAATAKDDALTRYNIDKFLSDFADKPGQYRSETHVDRLINRVAPLRGDDRRTMIVGVTEADIYGGDANFLFSGAGSKHGVSAGILSYARMQALTLNEPYQSRKRLVERLAKELVPASLKQLGIPRPNDPTDPYSYSSGTERLAQKTMTLSAPTREALDKFRGP